MPIIPVPEDMIPSLSSMGTHTHEHLQTHRHKHIYKHKEIIKYILKIKSMNGLRAWWSTTVIPAVRRQRQEDFNRLEIKLIYTESSRLPSYAPKLSQTKKKKCNVRHKWSISPQESYTLSSHPPTSTKAELPVFPNLILSLDSRSSHTAPSSCFPKV